MKSRKEIKLKAKNAFMNRYWTNVGVAFLVPLFISVVSAATLIFSLFPQSFLLFPFTTKLAIIDFNAGGVWNGEAVRLILSVLGIQVTFFILMTIATSFATAPISCGKYYFENEEYEGEGAHMANNVGTPWSKGFTKRTPRRAGAALLIWIFTSLWSLLFIIPGIIKSYAYSMTLYLMAMYPDMKATEAIKKSQEMMIGHKWQLFVMQLSFIGWMFISALTFGLLGIFYVNPYCNLSITGFFHEILKEGVTLGEVIVPDDEPTKEYPIIPPELARCMKREHGSNET